MGKFELILSNNETLKGAFNIFQNKKGAIILCMGDCTIELSSTQVNQLEIPLYNLIDFDSDAFHNYYRR